MEKPGVIAWLDHHFPPTERDHGAWTLFWVRAAFGAWLIGTPFFSPHFEGGLGISDLVCGLVVIVTSALTLLRSWARFIQIPLSIWIGVSPFVLEGSSTVSLLNEAIVGKTLLLIAVASPEMFRDD